jgi:hydroxymethylglutaryl-CoA lyase
METVTIQDVTMRDGLQDQKTVVPVERKVELLQLLESAGYRELEVTSFMRPEWVPQLADAEEVIRRYPAPPGGRRTALVANERGLDRALATDVERIALVASASDRHNRENLNRATRETVQLAKRLAARAYEAGRDVSGGVATAFGCPFQGTVSEDEVAFVVDSYLDAGIRDITLADTIGVAKPEPFRALLEAMLYRVDGRARIGLHLHDPGPGVSPLVEIALDLGIRHFDAAIGGLGGCPFAPGAPGNARAEEIVPTIERRGYHTGIDVTKLPQIALTLGLYLGESPRAPERLHA